MSSEIALRGRPAFYRRADRSRPRVLVSACRRAVPMSAGVHRAAASSRVIPAPFLQRDGGDGRWLLDGDSRRDDGGGGGQSVVWSFGSLDHGWLLRFLEHRVGDPRITSLIRRWLKAGILEAGELTANEKGTPQGGSVTPLTQKITSSLSGRFLAGASSRWLILDARSIILMSHGAIHTSAKGAKAERRVSSDRASDECGRGCGDIGARGSDFIASRLSLSRSSRPPQATGGDRRAGATHHLQDLRQCHWRVARVCRRARFDVERGRHSRHHGVREACSPTCVSGMARAISVSNTPSIVCSPPNSNKSTSCSFPTACAALAKL
jgi:hypothetical protein